VSNEDAADYLWKGRHCANALAYSITSQRASLQSICLIAGGATVGPSYLLFGCRGEQTDFYYSQLWQQLLAEGILAPKDGLLTAFSRDQKQKVYVQDKLRQHSQLMWDLLQQVASMVCVRVYMRARACVCVCCVLSSHPVLFRLLQAACVQVSGLGFSHQMTKDSTQVGYPTNYVAHCIKP